MGKSNARKNSDDNEPLGFAGVEEWIAENFENKKAAFGMPHWRVLISFEKPNDATNSAEIISHSGYEKAFITLDLNYLATKNKAELEETIEHELLHIIHAPLTTLYHAMRASIPETHIETVDKLYCDACEATVRNLERLVYALRNSSQVKKCTS